MEVEGEAEVTRSGIVLCGGRSRRMGRPKAWLPFAGELLLPRVVRIVGEVVRTTTVVAAPDQKLPPLPPEVRIARDREAGLGPLSGFAAGLASLPESVDEVFLSACDMPLLKPAVILRILELLGPHEIAVPLFEGIPQPLLAAYRVPGLLPRVERFLATGQRSLVALMNEADVRFVSPEELRDTDPNLDSLRNINTPDEYDSLMEPRP